jgi:nucleotide-binding universal stress UspA family protein
MAKKPAEALAELADERDARMIVIGSHGEGPIRGAILGSTPHKLLQRSGRPVLVVPAPDHDREDSDGR